MQITRWYLARNIDGLNGITAVKIPSKGFVQFDTSWRTEEEVQSLGE